MSGLAIRPATAADLPVVRLVTEEAYDIYEPLLGFAPMPVTTDYTAHVAGGGVWIGELAPASVQVPSVQVPSVQVPGPAAEPMPAAEPQLIPVAVLVTERGAAHLLIYSLAVRPDWQGEGHARSLLEHAEAQARGAGLLELRLFTNALMARNISLYRHCGFRESGRRAHPQRAGHEVVDMVRVLAGA